MITINKIKSSDAYKRLTEEGFNIFLLEEKHKIHVKTEFKHPKIGHLSSFINEMYKDLKDDIITLVLEMQADAIKNYINSEKIT